MAQTPIFTPAGTVTLAPGFATETTLTGVATESTAATLATEATLATRAADRTLANAPFSARLSDGTDFFESVAWGSDKYLGTAITQDVHESTANSSTANINAGDTWEGTAEGTLGAAGIQVIFKSDQACILFVDQGSTSGSFEVTDTWTRAANEGSARTFQAVGSFFRVRVQNVGSGATTSLRLATVLCPVVECLPRSLSRGGALRVSVEEPQPLHDALEDRLFRVVYEATVGTGETNVVLLANPPASGKKLVVQKVNVSTITNGRTATLRQYVSPTVTGAGGALTEVNCYRKASPVVGVGVATSAPTTSLPGTQVGSLTAGNSTVLNPIDGGLVLDPGQSTLFTAAASTSSTGVSMTVVWSEIPG